MMFAADLVLVGLAVLLFIPVATLFVEVAASLTRRAAQKPCATATCPPFAVLIPAHDEARLIAGTVRNVLPQLRPIDRLLVVADNCTDQTAAIARALGAEVIERTDPNRRGKGFALEFGIRHLQRANEPAVVVFIDADCQAGPKALVGLATLAHDRGRPVQGKNLSIADGVRGVGARFSEFAVRLKNHVRPLGCHRLGLACPMTGTGMAVPRDQLRRVRLGSDDLAEDLVLGIDLTLSGFPPVFLADALITSALPRSHSSQLAQRARWEQGTLTALVRYFPKLVYRGIMGGNLVLLTLACDLLVPPLALLSAGLVGSIALSAGWYLFTGHFVALAMQVVSLSLLALTVLSVWWKHGRDLIAFSELICIPAYILRKIPLYVGIVLGRRIGWVRSDRN